MSNKATAISTSDKAMVISAQENNGHDYLWASGWQAIVSDEAMHKQVMGPWQSLQASSRGKWQARAISEPACKISQGHSEQQ